LASQVQVQVQAHHNGIKCLHVFLIRIPTMHTSGSSGTGLKFPHCITKFLNIVWENTYFIIFVMHCGQHRDMPITRGQSKLQNMN